MTDEQKHLQEVAWNCVNAVRVWQGCVNPDEDLHKMLDTCWRTFEKMIKEWEIAIGHPSKISNETLHEIADKVTPIMMDIIERRIAERRL